MEFEWEAYVPSFQSPMPECELCNSNLRVDKVWRITPRTGQSVYPYITTHITGKPLEIKSSRHLSQIEKQYKVRLRDDKTYEQENGMSREVPRHIREQRMARYEAARQMLRDMR